MIPTVLVVYNRPQHTRQVIDSLRPHTPSPVYVFRDGPKSRQDAQAVKEVAGAVRGIDWTEPIVASRDHNVGLARSVVAAVDHTLGLHESMVLLEDDCVVGLHFYDFITACMSRYNDDKRVIGVTGYTIPVPESVLSTYPHDVYFIPRPGSWGWATWRDRWVLYERDPGAAFERMRKDGLDLTMGGDDIPRLIEDTIADRSDAWTPGWMLAVARHGLFAYPTASHVRNIGFDGTGVHCGHTARYDSPMATMPPSRFPDTVAVDDYVLAVFKRYYR